MSISRSSIIGIMVIGLLGEPLLTQDLNLRDYFVHDAKVSSQLDLREGNIRVEDATEAIRSIDMILDDHPDLLRAHLIRGQLFLHSVGNIEKAIQEFKFVQEKCKQIKSSDIHIMARYREELDRILYQINDVALPEIEEEFASLRFKIKNKRIQKFCHLRNIYVVFTWEDEVKSGASRLQEKRLEFLKNILTSGEMRFQFSAYDSTDGKFYFEIAYFPLIEVRGAIDEPYAMILNNERRYHFNINHQINEVIEIDWNDDWELVESVPRSRIKVEFQEPFTLVAYSIETGLPIRYAFTTPESELGLMNLYIPIDETKAINLSLIQEKRGEILEKVIYITTRTLVGIGIVWAFIEVR